MIKLKHLKLIILAIGLLCIKNVYAQTLLRPTLTSFSPTTGGPGDTLVLTGTNFSQGNQVSIGSSAAITQFVSSTTLNAILGTNTSGIVFVSGSNGNSDTLSGFTVTFIPEITSVTPLTGTTGDTITITGNRLTTGSDPAHGAPTISFGGVSASSVKATSSHLVKAVIGNGASGDISLKALSPTAATYPGFIYKQATPTITSFYPTTAGSGDTVYIHGTGLNTVWDAHFGNGSTATTHANDTLVVAYCGASGTSGSITLDYGPNYQQEGTVSKDGFTWSVNPIIYSLTPITGTQGDTILITGKFYTSSPMLLTPPVVNFGGVSAANVLMPSYNVVKAVVGNGASGNIVISNIYGGSTNFSGFVFKRINTWTGAIDSVWEKPGNWSNNTLPDSGTDVIINNNKPVVLNSDVTINSMVISAGSNFTINPDKHLTILH